MSASRETTPQQRADETQRRAADPRASVFVSASAGSGKTKLLTDRLLRLMLSGADPARILCLTFTKAAAAEMALRLQHVLGAWVTLADAALDAALARLDIAPSADARQAARALFARVLDLPGGMRIVTIHAFCQSLLRRFPLEAQISPHFQVVAAEDDQAALREAREARLLQLDDAEAADSLDHLAGLVNVHGFAKLVEELGRARGRLGTLMALPPARWDGAFARAAGVAHANEEAAITEACALPCADLAAMLALARDKGSPKVRETAAELLAWLALPPTARALRWAEWRTGFFQAGGKPRGLSRFANDKLDLLHPDIRAACLAEQERVVAVEDARRACRMAVASLALWRLAAPVLRAYEQRKERAAQLDYDDLIRRTGGLLVDPGAAWVLYKLDGGLDHLLLDEAQDTAPEQWDIAAALTAEFFAGEGARDVARSFFAVGDRKQSIYSFQGADVAQFETRHVAFRDRARDAGRPWLDATLDVSFRSTAPVLALVDAVFAQPAAAPGVVAPGETLAHLPARLGAAGRVEFWPLAPRPAPVPDVELPTENQKMVNAEQALAERVADWIAAQTDGSCMLEARGRALAPGDVLVLLRRRTRFAGALVGCLKARGVPVAGLDRLVLTEQPAVQDLLALADVLLLPQDDLATACFLTSPLGGLDDTDLMDLAPLRRTSLFEALRRRAGEQPRWQAAWNFLAALLDEVDFATPHALLARALGPLGGRARLFERLGAEAAEPIDELLGKALAYEAAHPPSLQGFLHWLRQAGAEVKREAGGAGGAVRIMTVHGAKGLQAPLVILPDTTALPKHDLGLVWQALDKDNAIPLWAPRGELIGPVAREARQARRAATMEEYNRLLYVALTRAEDRLVVCGWEPARTVPAESWYALVEAGMRAAGAVEQEFPAWNGNALVLETAQHAPVSAAAPHARPARPIALPAWAGAAGHWHPAPLPPEPPTPRRLAPSRPDGVELGPVPPAASPLIARGAGGLQRGQVVHALLQHLPDLPDDQRAAAAHRYAATLLGEQAGQAASEALSVLAHPELAPIFGPLGRAEVPITGVIGPHVVGGLIDRLAVLPDRVLIADFKTGRMPPANEAAVPVRYVRQLAAYRAVIALLYPDRPIRCALVWTAGPAVVMLSDTILDAHAPAALETLHA